MSEVKFAAIINSFNRLSLLKNGLPALLEALRACPWKSLVVVFDAGSTDGSQEWLREYIAENPQILIKLLPAQAGCDSSFSAGVNAACLYALQQCPDLQWLFLYETDNFMSGSSPLILATELLEQQESIAAVGYTVRKFSGDFAGLGCAFPSAIQFLLGQQISAYLQLDRPRLQLGGCVDNCNWSTCDVVYTSPLLIRVSAWKESEGMDAKCFPFSDCDIDWAWRLHELGWKMAVLDVDGVVHDNRQELSSWSDSRVLHFHRARLKLLARHLGSWVYCLKPLLWLRHLLELGLLLPAVVFKFRPPASLKKRWRLLQSVGANYEREATT